MNDGGVHTARSSLSPAWLLACGGYLALLLSPLSLSTTAVLSSGVVLLLATIVQLSRHGRGGSTGLRFARENSDVWTLLLVLLVALAILRGSPVSATSDGCIYLSYLRSAVFDGDLQIAGELAFLGLPERLHHVVPLGPALAWLPAYVTVFVIDQAGVLAGSWGRSGPGVGQGLTGSYLWAMAISSYLVSAAGLLLLHLRLRQDFARSTALLASCLVFGATGLLYYSVYAPSMPHAASFGLAALFVVAVERYSRRSTPSARHSMAIGFLFAAMVVTRPQNAVFGVFLVAFGLEANRGWRPRTRDLGWLLAGGAPLWIGQAIVGALLIRRFDYALVGSSGGYLDLSSPHFAEVLFSAWHGFFAWTPVAYVAAAGLLVLARRNRAWAWCGIAVLLSMAWINGSAVDWHGGWAFGGRRFTSTLVVLAPGLAAAIEAARRRPLLALAPVAAGAVLFNFLLMVQWHRADIPRGEPLPMREILHGQVDRFFSSGLPYPFSFPANYRFARREGLTPEDYDLLGHHRFRAVLDLPLGEEAAPLLRSGWTARTCGVEGRRCWSFDDNAELLLPLAPPAREAALELRVRMPVPDATGLLALRMNGVLLGRRPLTERWTDVQMVVPRDGIRRGFNRLELELESLDGAGSGDSSSARALVTLVRVEELP